MPDTRTGTAKIKSGGKSYTAGGIQYVPGVSGDVRTPVARTFFAPIKSNTMKPLKSRGKEKVQSSTRYAQRVNVGLITTAEGALNWMMNHKLATEYLRTGIGAEAALSAVSGVATGAVVTAGGTSVIPVPAGAYVPGEPVIINKTTPNEEPSHIIDYAAGNLILPALSINATAATPTVDVPATRKLASSLLPAGYDDDLGRLTVERVLGGVWAFLFPGTIVEKLEFNVGSGMVECTASMYSTVDWSYLNQSGLTPYNPAVADEKVALRPMTALDAVLALPGDVSASGTSALELAIAIESAKITLDNGVKKFQVLGNKTMQANPGDDAVLSVEYNEHDTLWRPHIWQDYIATDVGTCLQFGFAKNYGTTLLPDWHFVIIRIPYAIYEDSGVDDGPSKLVTFQHKAEGMVLRGLDQDLIQVFIA